MANFITYEARVVEAKGHSLHNTISEKILHSYLLDHELNNLCELQAANKIYSPSSTPTLFYPGCGVDVLFPLFFLQHYFLGVQQATLLFLDTDNTLATIKTILDDIGVTFSEKGEFIVFYWAGILVHLQFIVANAFRVDLPHYDIYFERAFRIMKEQESTYEQRVFNNLLPEGMLISDSGYAHIPLERMNFPNLSSYNEMVIGRKLS
jgi:hypothetical protein